jgi:ribonuclease P protein component
VLPARHRLRSSADFAAVLQGARRAGGSRSGSRLIVVHANSTDAPAGQPPRVGFVVSKAVGNAVVRNRTKRVLRHVLASRLDRVPAGTDLVVRANPPAADAASAELGADVDRLMGTVLRRLDRSGGP